MQFVPASEHYYDAIAHLIISPEELVLVHPSGRYPWDEEQLRAIAQERHNLTVGLIDGEVVAFSNLYDVQPHQSAFIGNVIVGKAARGRGVGQALIRHMMAICQQKYHACPHLSVWNGNTPAILMYSKLGFRPYQIEPRVTQTGEPFAMIHMRYGDEEG